LKTRDELLRKLPTVDISHDQIIQRYSEIDAFSVGRDKARPLRSGQTARVMGKNDLWILATAASVLKAALLAIDNDFDHLSNVFLDVIYIDQTLTAADI